MPTDLQKRTAEAIINIFETGALHGEYGNVTMLPGDAGHLTYGRSQTTLASGNLFLLISAYVNAAGAQYADRLRPYLARLKQIDLSLDDDMDFRALLATAGNDPVMHSVQDEFFDRIYWTPASVSAANVGITSGLGYTVSYDGHVQGSWGLIRDRTNAQFGTVAQKGENDWVRQYVSIRRNWLATSTNKWLPRTVYRMDEFDKLANAGNWQLDLPIVVRGVTIDESGLSGVPVRASAQIAEERLLMLRNPMMQGDDVARLQQALKSKGETVEVDGVFGATTAAALNHFQRINGLTADGIAGPATRSALGI